jgi:hypothetical protein
MSMQYDPDRLPPKPGRAMNDDTRLPDTRSVPELLADMVNQLTLLVRKEMQLARAEMGEKAAEAGNAIPGIAGGAGLAFGGLILLLLAAAAGISRWLDLAAGWGFLIVGVLAAIIGYALVSAGMSRLRATNLTPHRTAEQLTRDARAAKEQMG